MALLPETKKMSSVGGFTVAELHALLGPLPIFGACSDAIDQPSYWSSISAAASSPPANVRTSSYATCLHSSKRFEDDLQYCDYQEIKQEPQLPTMMEWTLSTDSYYFMRPPALQDPLLEHLSPAAYREKLRTRQRGYEKTYRKKKRVEFKFMRREWIQLEMKHRRLREQKHSHSVTYLHKATPLTIEALHQLQLEERALRRDLVSLQSLKAWYDVSMVRLPIDKEGAILRTLHEWETVSDCLLGVSCTAPFAPIKLTFSW